MKAERLPDGLNAAIKTIAQNAKGGKMDREAIEYSLNEIRGLTEMNVKKMLDAFVDSDDDLTVNYSVKYSPGRAAGSTIVQTQITFVESRVKQSVKNVVGGMQRKLELHVTPKNTKPQGRKKYNSLF